MTESLGGAEPVTVVILNYNSGAYLKRCLNSLRAQDCGPFAVIVGDNGSTDDSFGAARRMPSEMPDSGGLEFQFVDIGANVGFARGNNLLVERVATPLVALLNPDTEPATDWLRQLMDAADRHAAAGMFGSTQLMLHRAGIIDGAGDAYLACGIPWRGGHGLPVAALPPEGEVFSPCAAAALFRTDVFRSVGGFDESYFCYVEDVDLAFRIRLQGGRCIQVPSAVVYHAGGGSSGDGDFASYHGTRNMIWTYFKNMPGMLFWLLLPFHCGAFVVLTLKSAFRGNRVPVLKGIRDGLRGIPAAVQKRRALQAGRTVSIAEIAGALCWNPLTYLRRRPVSR
ncbi:MAG: glycosyltransferase family 2 protein [Alphaproteobacteria bacterium]